MSLTMYQASIPVFIRGLKNLSAIIGKAEMFAADKKIDAAVLIQSRLAPDMFPFSRQVQIACDMVKGCAARLAEIEIPSYTDTEATFKELQERIAKTISFLETTRADQIDGSETKSIKLRSGGHELSFAGQQYLLNFVYPNFYFHCSIAYAILRHNGVPIGKMDFLGAS